VGCYAEFVVAETDAWAAAPAKMDLADAGALPLVLLTGAQLVEEAVNPRAGEKLLVTGATGSVGRCAVFVAKSRGAQVYAGVRRSQKTEAAKLGVDSVVALDDDREIAGFAQLDCIADTVGGETIKKLLGKVEAGAPIGSVVGEPAGAKDRGLVVRAMLAHSDSKAPRRTRAGGCAKGSSSFRSRSGSRWTRRAKRRNWRKRAPAEKFC